MRAGRRVRLPMVPALVEVGQILVGLEHADNGVEKGGALRVGHQTNLAPGRLPERGTAALVARRKEGDVSAAGARMRVRVREPRGPIGQNVRPSACQVGDRY